MKSQQEQADELIEVLKQTARSVEKTAGEISKLHVQTQRVANCLEMGLLDAEGDACLLDIADVVQDIRVMLMRK